MELARLKNLQAVILRTAEDGKQCTDASINPDIREDPEEFPAPREAEESRIDLALLTMNLATQVDLVGASRLLGFPPTRRRARHNSGMLA